MSEWKKEWKSILADTDDDYLIGLSNKGIVKRAYKDKEETACEIAAPDEKAREITVKVGAETVTVHVPLGESKCTCPSRSICRHVVQAILVLRESCQEESTQEEVAGNEKQADLEEAGKKETLSTDSGEKGEREALFMGSGEAGKKETLPADSGEKGKKEALFTDSGEKGEKETEVSAKVRKEIAQYPLASLKKVLGNRHFQTFVNQVRAGIRPPVQYSSTVTVQLPEQGYVVRLLSPLEYSSCTCHKKEMCIHKAAAILWCQLEEGAVTEEELLGEAIPRKSGDMDGAKEAAVQMKAFLEELLAMGLSRTSPEMLDYLERLAVISHNAGLAKFEGYFRALGDSYDKYFKRKASFQTEELMGQITRLYHRTDTLLTMLESKNSRVAQYVGEFKAEYLPVGNLDLIGIVMEHFQSQTGYEGETVYFLEENTKKWYTYTNTRPVFYEEGRKRRRLEKSQAPWGLNISLEDLSKVRIHLIGAKCDDRMRLSSSQDTKGEITGEQGLEMSDIGNWYYRDFDRLFLEQIEQPETDRPYGQESRRKGTELVFVQPAFCAKAEFSQTGQQLSLPLYDEGGREIVVEVTYSQKESGTIRYLERISKKGLPCFLGKVYLRDGRVRMYPVDARQDGYGVGEMAGETSGDNGAETGKKGSKGVEKETEKEAGKDSRKKAGKETEKEVEKETEGDSTKFKAIEDILEEVLRLMEDLCQSGFDTVHDSTLGDVEKASKLTERYGMTYLSDLLDSLVGEISARRHQMKRNTSVMAGIYANICEYLYLGRQKAVYDHGHKFYSARNNNSGNYSGI